MNPKIVAGSAAAVALLGLGALAGSVVGAGGANAQAPAAQVSQAAPAAQVYQVAQLAQAPAATATPGTTQPKAPDSNITAAITQQQAEAAALAAAAGSTVDHTSLQNQNGTPVYDVDFTNGGGVLVDGNTGKVITVEAAGTDQGGGRGGHGGKGGPNAADQAALEAQAKIAKADAEKAAIAAAPGSTVDHTRIGKDSSGTLFWDVDFTNGGGVEINATTGAVIKVEAAGTDHPDGHFGRRGGTNNAPGTTPNAAPTPNA